jgi:hypothetical protein
VIYECSRSMTSSRTPEWAWRTVGDQEPAWRLSWLLNQLTREQARAGMELQELLTHPDSASADTAQALAAELGITVTQALSLLHRRMLDRRHS